MDPIETLRNEHGLIRNFVDLFSGAVSRLEVEEAHGADTFERYHKLVLDLDAMLGEA